MDDWVDSDEDSDSNEDEDGEEKKEKKAKKSKSDFLALTSSPITERLLLAQSGQNNLL